MHSFLCYFQILLCFQYIIEASINEHTFNMSAFPILFNAITNIDIYLNKLLSTFSPCYQNKHGNQNKWKRGKHDTITLHVRFEHVYDYFSLELAKVFSNKDK